MRNLDFVALMNHLLPSVMRNDATFKIFQLLATLVTGRKNSFDSDFLQASRRIGVNAQILNLQNVLIENIEVFSYVIITTIEGGKFNVNVNTSGTLPDSEQTRIRLLVEEYKLFGTTAVISFVDFTQPS